MSLDRSLSAVIRTQIISFLIFAFQSLDRALIRKECAPLVSISIWHNLATEKKREERLAQSNNLRKAWRAAAKRYDAADESTKARLRFDRAWLYTLTLDFLSLLYADKIGKGRLMSQTHIKVLTDVVLRGPVVLRETRRVPFRPAKSIANEAIC
jgi:intron-binding protein aquarius